MYWVLFAQCIVVKGATNFIICDVQRNDYFVINEGIYEILTKHKGLSIDEIKAYYNKELDEEIEDNMKFLISNQLVFVTENPDWFPRISLEWDKPSLITNAIIEFNDNITNKSLNSILDQLESLGCFYVELRILSAMKFEEINSLILAFEGRKIRNINLNTFYHEALSKEVLIQMLIQYQRIGKINLFSTPISYIKKVSKNSHSNISYHAKNISFSKACGLISSQYFISGIELFTESQKYNSCLNRKISIDAEGNIKNCPSMQQSFGNIKNTTLAEAIEKPDFKKYWNINKDKIHVCKDCEFRYICTDCRAYVEDPEDILSKPLKCGYNPYTGEWAEWSTNSLKQKAIDFYGMREILNPK